MQAYHIHQSIVQEYKSYLESFVRIRNHRIKDKVDAAFAEGKFLPKELIQFNPSYATGISIGDLVSEGLHPDIGHIFGNFNLYDHQARAIRLGISGKSFVLTSGTGSGKSLTFLGTIFQVKLWRMASMSAIMLGYKAFDKALGKEAVSLRKRLAQAREATLSFNEAVSGILELRRMHVEMDTAVATAYGWEDIALRHDSYQVDCLPENDRVRYTIHPEARREVLKRLLALNHRIPAEEVAAGLWEKKEKALKKGTGASSEGQMDLIGGGEAAAEPPAKGKKRGRPKKGEARGLGGF